MSLLTPTVPHDLAAGAVTASKHHFLIPADVYFHCFNILTSCRDEMRPLFIGEVPGFRVRDPEIGYLDSSEMSVGTVAPV